MDNIKPTYNFLLDVRRAKKTNLFPVKLVIYFGGEKKRYSTGIDVSKDDWERLNRLNVREAALKSIKQKISIIGDRVLSIFSNLTSFSFNDFEREFFQEKVIRKSSDLAGHFDEYIGYLNRMNRVGSADSYSTAKNSLLAFKPNLRITDITTEFLEQYEQYMLQRNLSPTTIGIYIRQLRRIVNVAINNGLFSANKYPFKKYTIPSSRNIKKALTMLQVKNLLEYQTDDQTTRRALDFWLFSYLCNGINMTDVCQLKPENLKTGFFYYYRSKTKNTKKRDLRPIKVPLTERSLSIIEKWKNTDPLNPYLFPILTQGLSARQIKFKVQDFIWKVNQAMRVVAKDLGIGEKINTYAARHCHATILKQKGASTEIIQENLGHSSIIVTQNYLDDFTDDVKNMYAHLLTDL